MITEFTLATGIVFGYDRLKNRDTYNIKKIFNNLMLANNLDYKILETRKNQYGYAIVVSLYGQGYEKLEKLQDLLESTYGATIQIQQNANIKTATIDIIVEKLTDEYRFKPVEVKPYELYIGKTYTMKDVVLSMKELPHVLVTGINSSGKTFVVITGLTNLIYFNNERYIEIYLSQISTKKDLRKFKDCKQCHGYASTVKEAYHLFNYIYHIMEKRISMFNSVSGIFIDDVYEWNTHFPNRQMRIIFVAMDEFTSYCPDSLDTEEDREIKQNCLDLLVKIIQQARCCGVYLITSLQRADKESIPPRIKAQFNCKINFKQPNVASSLVAVDSDKAFRLKPKREALVYSNDEYLVKTLYLDNEMVQEFIKPSLDINHKNYYNYKDITASEVKAIIPGTDLRAKSKNKVKVKK